MSQSEQAFLQKLEKKRCRAADKLHYLLKTTMGTHLNLLARLHLVVNTDNRVQTIQK